jgi:hypothetical protein
MAPPRKKTATNWREAWLIAAAVTGTLASVVSIFESVGRHITIIVH